MLPKMSNYRDIVIADVNSVWDQIRVYRRISLRITVSSATHCS